MNEQQNAAVMEQPQAPSTYADITVVFDRSSSMGPLRQSVIDGFNQYFVKMMETPGENKWSMIQFDDPDSARGAGETFPNIVFDMRHERDMVPLTNDDYKPRGWTALNDAVCKSIHHVDQRVSGREHEVKPIMMIVTDGLENKSREHSSADLRETIANRQSRGWEFLFLAANQDAWVEGGKYGMDTNNVASRYNYDGSSVLSGAIRSDGVNSFGFEATAGGMLGAIASGMLACNHIASGSLANSQSFWSGQYPPRA